jgi:DNA polymerase III epsilon subunit-like protein
VEQISERAAVVSGLEGEQPRYFIQHASAFRCTTRLTLTTTDGTAAPTSAGRKTCSMTDWMQTTPWTAQPYAVVDVEGNGRRPPDLVELAVVPIMDGVIGRPRAWLVRPDERITGFAQRIHGISNDMVAKAPCFAEISDEVREAFGTTVIVAHNAHVDLDVIQRKLPDWAPEGVIDTLKLARRLLPDQMTYKLSALVDALHLAGGLPGALGPHRAEYDALVTARLLSRLLTKPDGTPRSLADISEPCKGGDDGQTAALF